MSIVRLGSLKAAAGRLMLTESALSHSIRNLEESLGVKLFNRQSRRLKLTEEGRIVFNESLRILQSMEGVRQRLNSKDGCRGATFRVVVGPSFILAFGQQIHRRMRELFPGLNFLVIAGKRDQAIRALANVEADLALTVNPPEDDTQYQSAHLYTDRLRLVLGSGHPLLRHARLVPRFLCSEPIYIGRMDSYSTTEIVRSFSAAGFAPRHLIETASKGALLDLVAQNFGCSFQAEWVCRDRLQAGTLHSRVVEGVDIRRHWRFVWPAGAVLQEPAQAFIELCREAVAGESTIEASPSTDPDWARRILLDSRMSAAPPAA